MSEGRKKPQIPRQPVNMLDKAQAALQQLIEAKGVERASGRFGVVIVLDRGSHTGIRYSIDEAVYMN